MISFANIPYHQLVSQYGYGGLFVLLAAGIVGLPVPDETLMAFAGGLAAKGELHIVPAWVVSFLGSATGITVSFVLGQTIGGRLLDRYGGYFGVTPTRLQRVHDWFEHIGSWTLLIGYFVPGVRHVTAVVAGVSKLHWLRFAMFAYAGAALWVSTFIFIGYFVGDHWRRVTHQVRDRRLVVVASIACALVLFFAGRAIYRILISRYKKSS